MSSVLAAVERVEVFDITAAAQTAKASAVQTAISFPPGDVVGVEIVIPDGHMGLTGIQLGQANAQTIPRTAGAFIVGNDEVIRWPTEGFLNNGKWSAIVYNTDSLPHTFHIRFLLRELRKGPALPPIVYPIDPAQLSSQPAELSPDVLGSEVPE